MRLNLLCEVNKRQQVIKGRWPEGEEIVWLTPNGEVLNVAAHVGIIDKIDRDTVYKIAFSYARELGMDNTETKQKLQFLGSTNRGFEPDEIIQMFIEAGYVRLIIDHSSKSIIGEGSNIQVLARYLADTPSIYNYSLSFDLGHKMWNGSTTQFIDHYL